LTSFLIFTGLFVHLVIPQPWCGKFLIQFEQDKMNFEIIRNYLRQNERFKEIEDRFIRKEVPAKVILLKEGQIADRMFLVEQGCLRTFSYKDGKDITFQFFFENEGVASAESFFENKPSKYSIETIEKTIIIEISRFYYMEAMEKFPELKSMMFSGMQQRVFQYMDYMMSYIKDKPIERYRNLIRTRPEIVKRVPQHYIASYLGMTPVSLSRIRNRIRNEE
jgi:CRP-like cAMP-binding protein